MQNKGREARTGHIAAPQRSRRTPLLSGTLLLLASALLSGCIEKTHVQITIADGLHTQRHVAYILYHHDGQQEEGVLEFSRRNERQTFTLSVAEPSFVRLLSATPSWEMLLLVSPGERVVVELQEAGVTVCGSPESERIAALDGHLEAFRARCRHLESLYALAHLDSVPNARRGAILQMHRAAMDSMRKALLAFVEASPYSRAAPLALLAESEEGIPFFPIHEYDSLFLYLLERQQEVYETSAPVARIAMSLNRLGALPSQTPVLTRIRPAGDTVPPALLDGLIQDSILHEVLSGEAFWVGVHPEGNAQSTPIDSVMLRCADLPAGWLRFTASAGEVRWVDVSRNGQWHRTPLTRRAEALRGLFAWLGLEVCPTSYVINAQGVIIHANPPARELEKTLRTLMPKWRYTRRITPNGTEPHGESH